jgi:Spy/CpxP family protein refolding chaperone
MKIIHQWKAALGVALLALSTCAVYGQADQPQGPPPDDAPAGPHNQMRGMRGGPDRELGMLTHMLNLTADQQKGVKTVLDQQMVQMQAMRTKSGSEATGNETPEARRAQMEQIRDESNTKIAALLDEGQKKTFADWTERRKQAMARRQQGPNGDQPSPPPPPNE